MNRKHKQQGIRKKLLLGVGYPLLVAVAFCTMIPLLWLFSSSFKTANEIFAVPIEFFPNLPPRVSSSPYIVTNTYPKIQKPKSLDSETWTTLQPDLERVIWNNVQTHIPNNTILNDAVLTKDLRTVLIQGVWQHHVATLPAEVWNNTAESITNTIVQSIIPETIKTIIESVYRQVTLGIIEIEDVEFNRTVISSIEWESDSEIKLQSIRNSDGSEQMVGLSYDFQDNNKVRLSTTLSSSVPMDRIRRLILPVMGDGSYHRITLNVSVNAVTYKPTRPFVLDTALQEDTVWRLQGNPGELESSHIPMQQISSKEELIRSDVPQTDQVTPTGSNNLLRLQLTIHKPTYLAIVWDKFTSNYRNLWNAVPYNQYFINSVFIATASTLLTLFFCSLGGFAFAKYEFKGKKVLFGILLASMMIPFQVLLVPLFGLMYNIGWLNSYKAIIIPFSVGAFGVFLMRQFIVTIPSELIDAARIDGCSEFGIFYRVVLPIIKPALGALTIYSFLASWNGYLWPLIVLRDEAKYTLPIGLANLVGVYRQEYGMLMAGTVLSLLPIVILFLAMQREFVQGITLGGVKE